MPIDPELPSDTPPEVAEDEKSLKEALGMARGTDLSSQAELNKINEMIRRDGLDKHIHFVCITGVYLAFGLLVILCSTLAFHFIFPDKILSQTAANELRNFLFSSGLGGALVKGVEVLNRRAKGER